MFVLKPLHIASALSFTLPHDGPDGIYSTKALRAFIDGLDTAISEHGANPVGPLIMRTSLEYTTDGDKELLTTYIKQTDIYIKNAKEPYKPIENISIPNCLYFEYTGTDTGLISKHLETHSLAKEEGYSLADDTYTIFTSKNSKGDIITEVFIPILPEQ